MPSPPPTTSRAFSLRAFSLHAFSLIEAAIVLAVMALVISGIWVAYRSVNEARKVDEFVRNFLIIQNNIERMYGNSPDVTITSLADQAAWNSGLYKGVTGWAFNGTTTIAEWGYPAAFINLNISAGTFTYQFGSTYLPDSACIKIVSRITSAIPKKITQLGIGGAAVTSFPVVPTPAQCQQTVLGVKRLNLNLKY